MGQTGERVPARLYFDVISPFAYLHFHALGDLRQRLQIEYVPILFAGLLKHWGQKGPAEIAPKRKHTFRQVHWLARQHGIRFRVPPRHPFNPLGALRLLTALGASEAVVGQAFDFVFGEGRDPSEESELAALGARLGVTDVTGAVSATEVKQKLTDNTREAVEQGVFGVPTMLYRGELFWGLDSLAMLRDFLDRPDLFETEEMRRADQLPQGATRRL